jgi:hypothetical protein
MSNIIQSNPGIIDLREDNSMWSAPVNYEIPGYKGNENPAAQARAEYENDLYINALHNDQESLDVETGQPLTPIREGGAQAANPESVPAQGEMHAYAHNNGTAIDPADAEAVLSSAYETVSGAYSSHEQQPKQPEAATFNPEYATAASGRAIAFGSSLEGMRGRALVDWGAGESES